MGACRPIPWSPACARRAACSPRTRRGCCGRRQARPPSSTSWPRPPGRRARRWRRLLGWAEFCGLRIAVDPGVFVPRQRTAFLVAQAVRRGRAGVPWWWTCAAAPARSGRPSRRPARASRCTRPTSTRPPSPAPGATCPAGSTRATSTPRCPNGLRGRVDLLVVNAPYVPTAAIATMPPEARDAEPRVALDGGADGLDVQRRVAADAPAWLRPGGALLIETGADRTVHRAPSSPPRASSRSWSTPRTRRW